MSPHRATVLAITGAIAITLMLQWLRFYHSPLHHLATVADERRAKLVWVFAICALLSLSIMHALSAASRSKPGSWPLLESVVLVAAYVATITLICVEIFPMLCDYDFDLLYITSAIALITSCAKLVRAVSQRLWAKAAASLVLTLTALSLAVGASAMMLWFT